MRYHLRSSDRLSLRLTRFHPRLLSPRRLLRATGSEKMATMASVGGIRGASPRPTSRRRAASAADPYATKIANPRASSATARFESRRKPSRLTLIPPSRTNHPRSLRRFQALSSNARGSRARVSVARRSPPPSPRWRPLKKGKEPKRSKVEIIGENSDFLRHPVEQLATEDTFISEDAAQLYKFHGGYQQDDARSAPSAPASFSS